MLTILSLICAMAGQVRVVLPPAEGKSLRYKLHGVRQVRSRELHHPTRRERPAAEAGARAGLEVDQPGGRGGLRI